MGKPGSPWGRGPQPTGPTGRLIPELQGPGRPASPSATVRRGQDRALGALDGKAAPCPRRWGHGAPHRMPAQRGCPGLCVRSPALDTAHTVLCTHTQAHTRMHVHMHTCAHTHTHSHAHVCVHTCTCTCSCACVRACPRTFMHTCAHMHTHPRCIWAHSHALARSYFTLIHTFAHNPTHIPSQAVHMHTHTVTACT